MGKKFSKDPKSSLISINEFYENCNYLDGVSRHLWKDEKPEEGEVYYKFTSDKLICVAYTWQLTNFGMDSREKLDTIYVAYRDGISEFKVLEDKLAELINERSKHKTSKKLDSEIEKLEKNIRWAKKHFPTYLSNTKNSNSSKFEEFLIDTGRKFDVGDKWSKKPIIIDTETNGTRKNSDDLLSVSIYDPSTGICYNRYFPLELQPLILTTFIHGITDETLKDKTHWNQEEVDKIIEYFDLDNAFIFSYSGGQGRFDCDFINNYCKRHNLSGFEELDYHNIKSCIPNAPFGSEGQLTKDNLCRIFKIEGVSDIHSSLNDCVLEWQLLDKLLRGNVFFIQEHLYAFHPEYIIPVSYLSMHKELIKYAKLDLKPLVGTPTKIYHFSFPRKVLKKIKKFPTNITGITIENSINYLLNVNKQDNFEFLANNKRHLEYIGSLDSRIEKIPTITEDDGTIKTTDPKFEEYVNEVNEVTKIIADNLDDLIKFIKKKIFIKGNVKSQELVISEDRKVLALCDLSDNDSVLEIKTMNVISEEDGLVRPNITKQLYFQKKNRKTYLLSLNFETHFSRTMELVTDGLDISIYDVQIEEKELPPRIYDRPYMSWEIQTFNLINENNEITEGQISKITGRSVVAVGRTIRFLKRVGIIERVGSVQRGSWKVLKEIKDGDTYPMELPPNQ